MSLGLENEKGEQMKRAYPEKFVSEQEIFSRIHRGDRIFISTACAEPQYLVRALIQFVESNPKAFFDAEVIHVWSLGVAPYTEEKFKSNFRYNSFFVGNFGRGGPGRPRRLSEQRDRNGSLVLFDLPGQAGRPAGIHGGGPGGK